jgi:serine/threonine protein kinase
VYLVTELARGGELFETIVERGALSENRAGAIAHEIASALAFMHQHGLVHKDIKPENILLTARDDKEEHKKSDGSLVKLADFGSAGPASTTRSRMDDIGTSAYLPPELLARGVCTSGCDMWALGCVLYIMLSGSHPFDLDGTAPDAVVERRIKNDPVTFDVASWQAVSADAKDLVVKLLHKDPALRLTADQVLQHPWIVASSRARSVAHIPVMATSSATVEAKVA